MNEHKGWLLQSYPDEDGGLVIWFIDQRGERHQFRYAMQACCYAAGPFPRLRQLWRFLKQTSTDVSLAREQKTELFQGPIDVMAITTDIACQQMQNQLRVLIRIFLYVLLILSQFHAHVLPCQDLKNQIYMDPSTFDLRVLIVPLAMNYQNY